MLDNPNLTREKMFDALLYGTEIVGFLMLIVVAIILYIYRYEISLFIKFAFSDQKKNGYSKNFMKLIKTNFGELEKKEFDNKVEDLLNSFNNPEIEEDSEIVFSDEINIDTPKIENANPNFRSLKTIKNSNKIIYHFVNDGFAINGFSTDPLSDFTMSLEPREIINSNESGYFQFNFDGNIDNKFLFNLSYYDEYKEFHTFKYLYSTVENSITIIEL